MTSPLTKNELDYLLNFIGYGRLNADVWFLGMEEAGGGEENIRARLKFRQVEDCAEAHQILGITKHHVGRKIIQRTWRGMCSIMLGLEGKDTDTEDIRNYQADLLGRSQGNSLLIELMPIPKPNINEWGYEELIPQFRSRDAYYQEIKPRRMEFLENLLIENHPKIVIAYGKKYWTDFQELFPNLKFSEEGQFLVASDTNMVIVLTDHLTARSMNGKFDEIVSIIKSKVGYTKKTI